MVNKINRRGGRKTSKPDKVIRELIVGQKVEIEGSVSYWRNRQSLFHQENPNAWVSIYTENGINYAERLV